MEIYGITKQKIAALVTSKDGYQIHYKPAKAYAYPAGNIIA